MAYLSKGHLPTEGPYVEVLNRCIDFVLGSQRGNGLFEKGHAGSGPMYAHNISTLFLSEVSGMVDPARQDRIERALPRALELILQAQAVPKEERHRGGWRYHPGSTDSDTSCSGWALMALRSAKLNGAAVPDSAIEEAVAYLKRHQHEQYGCFGYTGNEDHARSLTGMGLLCLELCGLHGTPETIKAADYNAQATFQIGGNYWGEYGPWMYESYLKEQNPDGSWDSREAGRIYGTAIMVLSFTVPYRQLPIYQRDETVDELAP
jgi:hypothetical protein